MKIKKISELTAVLLFLAFLVLLFFSHRQDLSGEREITEYNSGWAYRFEEKSGTAELPIWLDVPKNTEVVFINTVPDEAEDNFGFVFRTRMQRVRVYIGDRLIYQYPDQELIGSEVASVWNFVPISEADAGEQIRLCLESRYTRFSGKVSSVWYGDYDGLVGSVLSEQTKIFRISFLIGIVGLLIILIAFLSRRHDVCVWQLNLGILLIIVSVWLCGESRMPSGIVGIEAWHYFTFLSLLFCPVFLTAYLYARWKEIYGKTTGMLFYLCLCICIVCLISKLIGGPDLVEWMPVMHVMIVITLGYAVLLYILAARREKSRGIRSELICILIIFLAGIGEMVRFYRTDQAVAIWIRMAILLYALDLLWISVSMLYRTVKENQELERRLRRSRAELMASQIKPHFIYNTLNSIRTLIRLDPEKARKTVYDFSTYLRSNLDNLDGREMIPFSEELRHIQAYLNIEKIRFEERLNIETDIRTKSFRVPPLTIQPLVENAVKHGICRKINGGTVAIRTYEEPDAYVVEVEDDGAGFDVSILNRPTEQDAGEGSSGHIGLNNIRFRMQEITGGRLLIESCPGRGTRVKAFFMKEKAEE